jgi:hypothetical protein
VDLIGSGSCPVAGFCINNVELLCSTVEDLVT